MNLLSVQTITHVFNFGAFRVEELATVKTTSPETRELELKGLKK